MESKGPRGLFHGKKHVKVVPLLRAYENHGKFPRKFYVLFGIGYFQGQAVSFRECISGGGGGGLRRRLGVGPRLVDWPFPKRQVVKGKNRGGIDIKPAHVSPGGGKGNIRRKPLAGWWFQTLFIFTTIWGNDPIWLIFFQMG